MSYTVIGTPASRAFRVMWMLEELGQDYGIDPVMPASDGAFAHHPLGKIPALVVDGTTLTDSSAILTYLADAHGGMTHAPGSLDRARQDAATAHVIAEIDAALWLKAKHKFALPEAHRLEGAGDVAAFEYQRGLSALERMFAGDAYLAGAAPTVPDLLLTHCLTWAKMAKMPEPPEALAAYYARMTERPAYHAARARAKAA